MHMLVQSPFSPTEHPHKTLDRRRGVKAIYFFFLCKLWLERVGEMSLLLHCLPHKREDASSGPPPQHPHKKPGVGEPSCTPVLTVEGRI